MAAFCGLYVLSYVFDCIDGQYARLYGMTTDFGDMYDHISDVVVTVLVYIVAFQPRTRARSRKYRQHVRWSPQDAARVCLCARGVLSPDVALLTGLTLLTTRPPGARVGCGTCRQYGLPAAPLHPRGEIPRVAGHNEGPV